MKPVRIILVSLMCGIVSTARADIASVQYVQSIISSIEPAPAVQANWAQTDSTAADYIDNKPTIPSTAAEVGLGNVQNVDTTNASNITSGTMDVARLPVGTTSTTVAAGDDVRFDTVSTTQPSGTPPSGTVFMWFN